MWSTASEPPALATGDVHVWRVPLECDAAKHAQCGAVLRTDEHVRADRIRIDKKRRQFIVARGNLRLLLSRYLSTPPDAISFAYQVHGKPYLSPDPSEIDANAGGLHFNVSHSGERAVIAVTRDDAVGVDIEKLRDNLRHEGMAQRFFSPTEADALMSLPPAERLRAFFTCWTRKEAFIKAKGPGLHLPLDQFDVTLRPGEAPTLLRTQWDAAEAGTWRLIDLPGDDAYAGALAIQRGDVNVRFFDLE